MQKICGRFAVNRDALSRARMDKLKMRGMKSNALNQLLRRFRWVIFSVPDYRVARRRKLHADLILESCHQLNPYERSIRKKAFDGIPEFGASGFRVFHGAQLLIHSFTSKIVDERSSLSGETAAHDRKILPHRSVGEKLPHQRGSIRRSLGKKQSPRRKSMRCTINVFCFFNSRLADTSDHAEGVAEPGIGTASSPGGLSTMTTASSS
jgi:hypothetical protein